VAARKIQIRYLSRKFIGMAIYRAKSVPQKSPTPTDLRSNEATKIYVLHALRLTRGQCCRVNQHRSTIKSYNADFTCRRIFSVVLRSHKTRLIDRQSGTFLRLLDEMKFELTITHRLSKNTNVF